MKYAVVESGGKQYIAREGESVDVDRLKVEVGEQIKFDQVLLTSDDGAVHVGEPIVGGASVTAHVEAQVKGPKIVVFKYKPRIRYRRKQGHRQYYTRVRIDEIRLSGGKPAEQVQEPEASEPESGSGPAEYDLGSMRKAELEELATELGVMPESGSGAGGNVLVKDLRMAIEKHLKDR